MVVDMIAEYHEFSPVGLLSIAHSAAAVGIKLDGILGDNRHTFGYHISAGRLIGTGHAHDYSLNPLPSATYHNAGAAIDLTTGPAWQGEWLESVRAARRDHGRFPFLAELIGDPDLIPGPKTDAHVAQYAAASTGWSWTAYTGSGHVAWCHLGIRRDCLGDATLGSKLFAGWNAKGKVV